MSETSPNVKPPPLIIPVLPPQPQKKEFGGNIPKPNSDYKQKAVIPKK